jgi:hypothetical protein
VCIFSKVGWKTINFAKEKKGKNVGWQNFLLWESLFVSLFSFFLFFFGGGELVKL